MKYYLSTYLFLILYTFFSIIEILNENIFLISQGKKLNKKLNQSININIKFSKYEICTYLILIYLNILLTIKYCNYNILTIKILGKTIDLVSMYCLNVKYIYIIYIFLNFASVFLKFLKKSVKKIEKEPKIIKTDDKITNNCKKDVNFLNLNGLYQNILITGSIGSGKTFGAINLFTKYFIDNNLSGLILDIKGNYLKTLKNILNYNNKYKIIDISFKSKYNYNPLNKKYMNEYEIANYIRNTLETISDVNNQDSYWLDKVENVLQVFIILIRLNREEINFLKIHELVINVNNVENQIKKIKKRFLKDKLSKEELYKFNFAVNFINSEYKNLDERVMSIIKSEITRMTIPFVSNYETKEKFCTNSNVDFSIDNQIIILSMNIGENKAITKIISAFLKNDFQQYIMKNISNPKTRFFICDEYQEFALKSDAEFLALSREAKCISVLAMQSYTSLKTKLKNEDQTKLLIQNCVNKIWFRQDDNYTIECIIKQLGKHYKTMKSHTYGENARLTIYNPFNNKFNNCNSNLTENITYSKVIQDKYNYNYFSQELKTLEALVLYSDGEKINIIKKDFSKKEEI